MMVHLESQVGNCGAQVKGQNITGSIWSENTDLSFTFS